MQIDTLKKRAIRYLRSRLMLNCSSIANALRSIQLVPSVQIASPLSIDSLHEGCNRQRDCRY